MDTQRFPYLKVEEKNLPFIVKDKVNIGILTQTRTGASDEKFRSIELAKFSGVFEKQKHNIVSLDYFVNEDTPNSGIIDVFPAAQQPQARSMLSQSLRLVVTQQLFKKKDGTGRVGVYEVMVCNNAVQNLIREDKVFQIPSIMQTASAEGMVTMDKAIQNIQAMGSI